MRYLSVVILSTILTACVSLQNRQVLVVIHQGDVDDFATVVSNAIAFDYDENIKTFIPNNTQAEQLAQDTEKSARTKAFILDEREEVIPSLKELRYELETMGVKRKHLSYASIQKKQLNSLGEIELYEITIQCDYRNKPSNYAFIVKKALLHNNQWYIIDGISLAN